MRRRFEFRLERVHRVRDVEERVARAERAQAEALARAAEASRDLARSVLEQSRTALRELLLVSARKGTLEPREVLAAQRALDGELANLRRRVESARTVRMQAERMAVAHGERKSAARALEELRERARLRHAAQLEKHENAALDEVAQRLAEAVRRTIADGKEESASRSDEPVADQGPNRRPG